METRLHTFNGWQMRATVESRPSSTGSAEFYIVEPITFREFSGTAGTQADPRGKYGPFRSDDAAFDAAFKSCRFAIGSAIKLRGYQRFG